MIPVIDLNPLWQGPDGLEKIAGQLEEIYSTIGFAQVINHQIPPETIRALYQASHDFHQLPDHEKQALRFKHCLRGFIPLNASTLVKSQLGQAKLPNQSESFMVLSDLPKEHKWYSSKLGGQQIWPAQLPEFTSQVQRYAAALRALGHRLMHAFTLAMHVPADTLDHCFTQPLNSLRLLRYPPRPADASPELYGSAPHTDYGCLTLLHQDASGGLQVQLPDTSWIDVAPMEDALVLNTGQMMEIWSNGRLRATRHRVINKGSGFRYSMPFFYDCNIDAQIAPLAGCITPDNPPRYPAVIYGDNLEKLLSANYQFE